MKLEWNEMSVSKGEHFYSKIEVFNLKLEFQITYDKWLDVYVSNGYHYTVLVSQTFENTESAKKYAQEWFDAEISKLKGAE